jgi:aspartyl-tRNA(Asn)/glutamyl-tRNA(Gln) amidotransferase subunit A
MGSDTGGSVRVPAARSGVAGLKPTYGLISRHGVINNSFSFDHCGPLAWTVEDCTLMLQAVAGFDARDPGSAERQVPDYSAALVSDLKGWRIGVVRHFWEEDLPASQEERSAMEAALDVFRELGATLEDVRLRSLQDYFDVKIIVAESEIHSVHQRDLQQRPGDFGADFMGKILLASLFSASDYVQAQRTRRQMLVEMEPIYSRYDVLVTAGMSPAPRFEDVRIIDFWEKPNMTTPFSVTAGPALSVCNGYTESGLPMSMQVVGRPFDEI